MLFRSYAVVALQAIDGISRLSRLTLKSMADEQVELRGPLLSFPLSNMYSYSADPSWTGNPTSPLATKGTGTPPTFSASPFAAAAGMEGAAGASFAGGAGLKATDYVPTTSSNLSIELLVNCSTAPTVNGAYALTALYAAGGASVLVFIDNSGAIAVCRPNIDYVDTAVAPPRSALGTINVCDGKPHHVVVTYAGTALKVYVDGNLDASASTSTFSVGSGCELRMGRFQQAVQTSGSTYEFVDTLIGSLAYVSVYGYAIAAAQVLDNYHAFILGGAGDTTDQRFTRIANYAAWPSSVNATSSDIVCAVSPLNGVTAYDALQAVVSTEGGAWYADGAGVLQFQDRSVRTSAAMSAPEVTATNQITPGVTFPGDKQYLKNVISVTTASGNQYTVSDTASVTRSGVYSDDLGTLLGSLLDRQQLRALTQLAEVFPDELPDGEPDAFLLATVRALIGRVLADPDTWRPILVAGDGTPAVVRDRIDGDRDRIRAQIADLLAVGIERRGGPDLDVEVASYAAVAVLESFGRLLLEGRLEADRMVAFAGDLLRGLR